MAYIDWWNRTGPVTLGERFGLNEISIARNTLSPTKSYTEDRIDMKPGGIVEPGVEYYGGPGSGPKTKGPDSPAYKPLSAEGKKIALHVYGTLDISDRKRRRINRGEITMDYKSVKWNPEKDITVKSKQGQPVTDVDFKNLKLPDGTDMEKAFIEDLKLRAKQPQKAVIDYGNEWFADKYPIGPRQLDRAIPFLIKKHKIKYLEIEETPMKRSLKQRKIHLDVSSSVLEEGRMIVAKTKILKEKNLARKIDFAHRVSKKHMARLGLQFDTNLIGMDSRVINQVIIRPSEKKLDRLYTKQFKIFEQLKDNPTNELLKKQLADINKQVKDIIKITSGRLVGVTIDPNTLESSFEGLKKKYSLTQFMNENITIKDLEKLPSAEQEKFLTKQLTKAVDAEIKKGFVPNDFKTILSDKKSQEALLKYAKKRTPELIGKLKWAFKNPTSKVSMKLLTSPFALIGAGYLVYKSGLLETVVKADTDDQIIKPGDERHEASALALPSRWDLLGGAAATTIGTDLALQKTKLKQIPKELLKSGWKWIPFLWTPAGEMTMHALFSEGEPELKDFAEAFTKMGIDMNSDEFKEAWDSVSKKEQKEMLYKWAGITMDKRSLGQKVKETAEDPFTHMRYAFWKPGIEAMKKALKYSGGDKTVAKQWALKALRMGIPMNVIKFINPIGWHLTAATTLGKIYTGAGGYEAAQGAFRKDGENIFKGMETQVLPSMIAEYEKKWVPEDKRDKTIIDYSKSGVIDKYRKAPDDLKTIAQRNRNVEPTFIDWLLRTSDYKNYQDKQKDELAMGGIASLMK